MALHIVHTLALNEGRSLSLVYLLCALVCLVPLDLELQPTLATRIKPSLLEEQPMQIL